MKSQDKVVDTKEFLKWARKRNYKLFLIQFKLDGISIELQLYPQLILNFPLILTPERFPAIPYVPPIDMFNVIEERF